MIFLQNSFVKYKTFIDLLVECLYKKSFCLDKNKIIKIQSIYHFLSHITRNFIDNKLN